ncbi:MAG TPA: hypothetical protein DEB25_09040 [Desulfobulbaceae bacterium]|nr:hypothetical protein [Desulfobulbaceae bacterium]
MPGFTTTRFECIDPAKNTKERGVKFGPPVKVDPQKLALAKAALDGGQSVSQVAAGIGVHPATLYRHLNGGKHNGNSQPGL